MHTQDTNIHKLALTLFKVDYLSTTTLLHNMFTENKSVYENKTSQRENFPVTQGNRNDCYYGFRKY